MTTTEIPSDVSKTELPTITFEHAGVTRTLGKHNKVQQKLRDKLMSPAEAKDCPWYLRYTSNGERLSIKLKALKEKEVIREACDILNGQSQRSNEWTEFMKAREAKKGVTIGELAKDWIADGLPFSKTKMRTDTAAAEVLGRLKRALPWWQDKPVAAITPSTHDSFVAWRRKHTRQQQHEGNQTKTVGSRSADIEMAVLSCLCQWAKKTERIQANPFEERERFTDADTITHCHLAMSDNDEQFHSVLSFFFTQPAKSIRVRSTSEHRTVIGAWFAFSAMSGLRPGEHEPLLCVPEAKAFPTDLRTAPYGLIYPMPDGTRRMKVDRTKHGQNPAILIHPALQDFLDHYLPWLDANIKNLLPENVLALGKAYPLFPGVCGEGKLVGYLRRACKATQVKKLKPHGFGRAYYVRVRRSQGIDDSTIANELGQKSDGALIRSVYGDPLDPVGGNLHNWLPDHGNCAWSNLTDQTVSNVIRL